MNNECTKENVEKRLLDNKILFLGLIIFFQVVYWINVVISRGCYLQTYFSNDINDTFMDFFNMLNLANYDDPYIFQSNYPPFVFMILKLLYRIVPLQARTTDAFALRDNEFAFICLILFFLVSYGLLIYAVRKLIQNEHLFWLTIVVCILSGPMLFCVERGNVLLLSIACLMMYMAFWDSPQKWKRYVAYVFLAISAAIKIYPACFGLLVLLRKRWKEAFNLLEIGLIVYLFPILMFNGFETLKSSINGIFIANASQSNLGMGYNFSARNLWKIICSFGGRLIDRSPNVVIIIATLIVIVIFISSKEYWKKAFALCMFCIWIPEFSYTYTLLLFLIPFVLYISESDIEKDIDMIYAVAWIIILIPLNIPKTSMDYEGAKFYLSWPTVIINMALLGMCCAILFDSFQKEKSLEVTEHVKNSKEGMKGIVSKWTGSKEKSIQHNTDKEREVAYNFFRKKIVIQNTNNTNHTKHFSKIIVLSMLFIFTGLMLMKNSLFFEKESLKTFHIDETVMSSYEKRGSYFLPKDENATLFLTDFEVSGNELQITFNSGLEEDTLFQFYNSSSEMEQYLIEQKTVRKGYRSVSFYFENTSFNAIRILAKSPDGSHLVSIPSGVIEIKHRFADLIQNKVNYWLGLIIIILLSVSLAIYLDVKEILNISCRLARTQRESNLELLRIICMVFLVAHHFAVHGGLLGSNNSIPKYLGLVFLPVGKMCFIAFVAISMYFLVEGESKFERFLKCWLEVAFYSVTLTVVTWALGGIVSFKDFIGSMFVMIGNSHGFAASYLLFLLIYPFILRTTKNCSKKQARYLLLVLFWIQIMSQIIGTWIGYKQPVFSELTLFVFCFILSMNLKKYPINILDNKLWDFVIIICIYLYAFVINMLAWNGKLNAVTGFLWTITGDESSIFYVIGGYALFYMFKNLHVSQSKLINIVASGTFGILLIHDHNFFRHMFWNEFIRTQTFLNSEYLFVYFCFTVIAIFITGTVIDYLRQMLLENRIVHSRFFTNVSKKMNVILVHEEKSSNID